MIMNGVVSHFKWSSEYWWWSVASCVVLQGSSCKEQTFSYSLERKISFLRILKLVWKMGIS